MPLPISGHIHIFVVVGGHVSDGGVDVANIVVFQIQCSTFIRPFRVGAAVLCDRWSHRKRNQVQPSWSLYASSHSILTSPWGSSSYHLISKGKINRVQGDVAKPAALEKVLLTSRPVLLTSPPTPPCAPAQALGQ